MKGKRKGEDKVEKLLKINSFFKGAAKQGVDINAECTKPGCSTVMKKQFSKWGGSQLETKSEESSRVSAPNGVSNNESVTPDISSINITKNISKPVTTDIGLYLKSFISSEAAKLKILLVKSCNPKDPKIGRLAESIINPKQTLVRE